MALMNFRGGSRPQETPGDRKYNFYKGPTGFHDSVGWFWTPRVKDKDDYPLDLDFSLRVVNPRRGLGVYPYPYTQMTWDGKGAAMGGLSMGLLGLNDLLNRDMLQTGAPGGPIAGTDYLASFTVVTNPWTPKETV